MRATITPRATRRWLVAVLATAGVAAVPAAADAVEFGIQPGTAKVQLLAPDETPQSQAGAHPDLRVGFQVATTEPDRSGNVMPAGSLRDVDVRLPPGLIGSLRATPICLETAKDTEQCPRETMIGTADVWLSTRPSRPPGGALSRALVFRLQAPKGVAARLGFKITGISIILDARVTADGGYRLASGATGVSNAVALFRQELTLWGVPADHNGDGPLMADATNNMTYGVPGPGPRLPFMWAPTRCGTPLDATIDLRSWQQPEHTVREDVRVSDGLSGCDQLPFAPTLAVQPDTKAAGQPSGYTVDLSVPQQEGPDDLTTAQVRDATVTLPEGVAISPGRARGLDVCTDAQLGAGADGAEACPAASRVGEVRIDTPLLPDPLTGSVYMAEQRSQDPASGDMYRMFVVGHDPVSGVRIKLVGRIKADPRTGQLTTVFADNPQMPFSRLSLRLDGGDKAALVNPMTCGEKRASLAATAWTDLAKTADATFTIDQGCPTGSFAPSLTAGTASPLAGQFSPFAVTVQRADGDQDLSQIGLDLPSGLLAALGSVPLCPEPQAAAGSCDAGSRIGTATVAAGTGASPYSLGGPVYLGGPYKGAPFSLSIAVPAKAGPFDLGLVVVRSRLLVDANHAKASVVSDPLPTIVGGVPLHLQRVQIELDRPGFTFNATSCQPMQIGSTLTSTAGATAAPAVRYQAQGCDRVPLRPTLSMTLTGNASQLGKFGAPGVEAELTQTPGQSGLRQVRVTLPESVALNTANANKPGALCEPAQAAARSCPESSQVGWAEAETPALHEPLKGPIYFVRGERIQDGKVVKTLPGLYVKLDGEGVPLDLRATSSITRTTPQRLIADFAEIPDAPIKRFRMSLKAGSGSVLQTAKGVCPQAKLADVTFSGHTGGEQSARIAAAVPGCGFAITSTTSSQRRISARVSGIGAGTLQLSGSGLASAKRKIRSADRATIAASLKRASVRKLARGRAVKVKIRVRFAPKVGKARTVTRTVTVKPARRARKR
ncbi:hypothetical protein [Patulibacter defluvii]|uniref:hypothetical protein n=1 Tax=Patulibacter defluvii TaxID=3095358 RepID=UPI002A753FD3|nr:hypothetical protein [Patulibacter sp. DM4]